MSWILSLNPSPQPTHTCTRARARAHLPLAGDNCYLLDDSANVLLCAPVQHSFSRDGPHGSLAWCHCTGAESQVYVHVYCPLVFLKSLAANTPSPFAQQHQTHAQSCRVRAYSVYPGNKWLHIHSNIMRQQSSGCCWII